MIQRLLFVVATLVLVSLPSYAGTNGSITGVVKDKDGNAIVGATIKVIGTTRGAITKAGGKYIIGNVPVGNWELQCSYIGYAKASRPTFVSADKEVTANFTIVLEAAVGKTVTVTGQKAGRDLVEQDRIGIIKSLDNREVTNTVRENLQSVVNLQAGVLSTGQGWVIRGSRPQESQIRMDGLDIADQFQGSSGGIAFGLYPTVSMFATEEVQVLTGNFGAEYGNALGGVVNSVMKTGRTDRYEGFLRYRTDVPGLFGTAGNGLRALADYESSYEFGVGGPIATGLTFFITSKLNYLKYSGNSLDARDPLGNRIGGFFENNSTMVRNIAGRLKFILSDNMYITAGAMWGATSAEANGWGNLYAQSQSETYAFNPTTNRVDTTVFSTVPEGIAKAGAVDQFISNAFVRFNHSLNETGSTFYEVTVSNNRNANYNGRRKLELGAGSLRVNGVLQDPSRVTNSMTGLDFFNGFDYIMPQDNFRVTGSGTLVDGKDNTTDQFQDLLGDKYLDGNRKVSGYALPNPLTGYVEGGNDASGTNNAYGLQGFFYSRGNNDGYDFRSSEFWQTDGNFNTVLGGDGKTAPKHTIKTGFDVRLFTLNRHNNGNPWVSNAFLDVYEDGRFGGPIYIDETQDPKAFALANAPYKPINASMFVQDQVTYKGIVFSAGVRFDMLDPNSNFLTDPNQRDFKQSTTTIKTQISPRLFISYPIGERSLVSIAYGVYAQMPQYSLLYDNTAQVLLRGNAIRGNPNLNNQRTNQFNISYQNQLTDDFSVEMNIFYKDMYNITGLSYVAAAPFTYSLYTNGEYGNARGIEMSLRKRLSNHIGFNLNYTLQSAVGTSSSPGSNYSLVILNTPDPYTNKKVFPLTEYALDFDRRHRVNFSADFNWQAADGPSIAGIYFLENLNINLSGFFQTGTPYTKLDLRGNQVGEFNGNRQPSFWQVDLRLNRTIPLRDIFGDGVGNTVVDVFVDVINLLNRTEPTGVFARTGSPDFDGLNRNRPIGEFTPTTWFANADPFNAATIGVGQYDNAGNRRYNKNADFNNDGLVTQAEQFAGYQQFVRNAVALRGNYQFPRQVFVGFNIRF